MRTLSFPLQMVIILTSAVLSAASVVWVGQSGMKDAQAQIQSDVRNISTRMEAEAKIRELQQKAQESSMTAINNDINEMKRRLELVQIQYAQLRETMLTTTKR